MLPGDIFTTESEEGETREVRMSLEEAHSILAKWWVAVKVRWGAIYKRMKDETVPFESFHAPVPGCPALTVQFAYVITIKLHGATLDKIGDLLSDHKSISFETLAELRKLITDSVERVSKEADEYLAARAEKLPQAMAGFKQDIAEHNLTKGDR